VWLYAKRQGNKVYCDLCIKNLNNEFCCIGGTTGSLGKHLKTIHNIKSPIIVTERYVLSIVYVYIILIFNFKILRYFMGCVIEVNMVKHIWGGGVSQTCFVLLAFILG